MNYSYYYITLHLCTDNLTILEKNYLVFGLYLIGCIIVLSCQSGTKDTISDERSNYIATAMDRLPDNEAGNVVRKAIDYAGGWESWASKKNLSLTRVKQRIDSTGVVYANNRQFLKYRLPPDYKARMTWEANGDKITIINNGQQAWKFKNGVELTDQYSRDRAWNTSFGSNYSLTMPFKLTDPGALLSYEGLDTLSTGTVVHAIRVDYEKGAGSAGGMHTWRYFFDKETYALTANYLQAEPDFSFSFYDSFAEVDGIKIINKKRVYVSNVDRVLIRLKTLQNMDDIRFDKELGDELFDIKFIDKIH